MATSTGIRKIDSKGYGVFALKPIGRGTSHVMASKLKKIFHANCFGDEESSYIYLKTSRFNHACIPNVVVATEHAVIALRDIPIGQELEITYLSDRSSGWTARQRKALLPLHYGFECRCIACRPSKFMWLSDCRRRLIGHLKYALDGSLPKYGQLEKLALERVPGHPARRMPLLTAVQRIEYSFLLACLYEAEGHSPPQEVADLYTRAANALGDLQFCYHNVKPVKDLIFLESFRCIRAWYDRAIAIDEAVFGKAYSHTKLLRSEWEEIRDKSMYMFACLVLGEQKMRPHSGDGKEPFATQTGKSPVPIVLTEKKCRALIEKRLRSREKDQA